MNIAVEYWPYALGIGCFIGVIFVFGVRKYV